ncbi:hypothetical protein RQP46_009098 [Phenoliferia psychrophenolica]
MRSPVPQLLESNGARRDSSFVLQTAPPPFAPYNNAPYYQPYPGPAALANPYPQPSWGSRTHQPWLGEDAGRGESREEDGSSRGGEGSSSRSSFGAPEHDWGVAGPRNARSIISHHLDSEDRPHSRSPFGAPDAAQWGSQAPLPPQQQPQNALAGLASFANYYEESYRRTYTDQSTSGTSFAPVERARSSTASDNTSDDVATEPELASTSSTAPVVRKVRRPRKPRRRADEEPRDFAHRRYTCDVCGPKGEKTFARPSALALHMVRPAVYCAHLTGPNR